MKKIKYYIKYLFYYIYKVIENSYYSIHYDKYRIIYDIAESFRFNGKNILLYGEGTIKLGESSYIGDYSTIQSKKGFSVNIGSNCAISHNVRIYTSNYNANDIINNNIKNSYRRGDVIIGNNCWIGANVFICENITIGSNVVIAANSVVTKNIPSNCVVGGVPAKIIKKLDTNN